MTAVLVSLPVAWAQVWTTPLAELAPAFTLFVHERDNYDPKSINYVLSFRPPTGLLKSLPNLKVAFSLGAGVDGFLADGDYPRQVPLVRLVDHGLSRDMTHYIVMHTLIFHRDQRAYDAHQREGQWRQALPARRTEDTRVGILGLGEIGTLAATRLRDLDFAVAGWSRNRKEVPGIQSFAGNAELDAFLNRSDILVCVLPLTPETRGILNRETFAKLPHGAFVINVARGGHLIEDDLIAAIDEGRLAGAVLDVFQHEPLAQSSPLWTHPRITITPHIAALSDPRAVARAAIEGIARHERGEALENRVDLSRGY
ncbi:MAG TPA: glyoxylate/hydroxypyruvate reductase A [Rhizomicrobium sp.]